jgi:hypothetical protein
MLTNSNLSPGACVLNAGTQSLYSINININVVKTKVSLHATAQETRQTVRRRIRARLHRVTLTSHHARQDPRNLRRVAWNSYLESPVKNTSRSPEPRRMKLGRDKGTPVPLFLSQLVSQNWRHPSRANLTTTCLCWDFFRSINRNHWCE